MLGSSQNHCGRLRPLRVLVTADRPAPPLNKSSLVIKVAGGRVRQRQEGVWNALWPGGRRAHGRRAHPVIQAASQVTQQGAEAASWVCAAASLNYSTSICPKRAKGPKRSPPPQNILQYIQQWTRRRFSPYLTSPGRLREPFPPFPSTQVEHRGSAGQDGSKDPANFGLSEGSPA